MEKLLIDSNIVVVSRGFNVPLFSQLWLKKKEIFSEEELLAASPFFTPVATQVDTKDCILTIQAERIQLGIKDSSLYEVLIEKLRKIILALPECPYTGIGFNFTWSAIPATRSVLEISKENFLPKAKTNPWNKEFGGDKDTKIGAFYSKKFEGAWMNVDIRPKVINVASENAKTDKESISFSFNFHHDLNNGNPVELIQEYLGSWCKKFNEAQRIVELTIE